MSNPIEPTRRTVVRGVAWTAPVIAVSAVAPAFAASLRKDPGINGWVQVSYGTDLGFDAQFDSTPSGVGPDGAPFGLYLYDVNTGPGGSILDTVTNAAMTIWLRAEVRDGWSNNSGHGSRWGAMQNVGTSTLPDGLVYRGYRSTYNGSVPGSGFTLGADGRLYLQDFNRTARDVRSSDATFWVERTVTVNGEVQSFRRRNGERGPLGEGFPAAGRRAAGGTMSAVL